MITRFLIPVLKFLLMALLWLLKTGWHVLRTVLFPAARNAYLRLPSRKARAAVIASGLLVVIGLGLGARALLPALRPTRTAEAAEHFANQILQGSWTEQQEAAERALANIGIQLAAGMETQPGGPFVIPPELTLLAADAAQRPTGGRLTLAQFAALLVDLGFPFAAGQDPALLLQSGMRDWVNAARATPRQRGAAAPLFLQAMALQQRPAIDLTADSWEPGDYRLTYLEMQIFIGAFFEGIPTELESVSFHLFGGVAHAAEPPDSCSAAKDWLSNWGKQEGLEPLVKTNIELVNVLISHLTGEVAEKASGLLKKVLTPLSAALKLVKLATLYWAVEVQVEATPWDQHKPGPQDAGQEIAYRARAGVNREKYKAYLQQWNASPLARQIKDCLGAIGLPVPTDTGEIAADVENWSVEWDLVQGGGQHATIGLAKNTFTHAGQFQMALTRVDDATGEARLVVDVTPERTPRHEGPQRIAPVMAQVTLETSAPPALSTYLNGAKSGDEWARKGILDMLGLTDTMLEVLAGWFQEMVEPKAYGWAVVTYHEPRPAIYQGTITWTEELATDEPTTGGYTESASYTLLERETATLAVTAEAAPSDVSDTPQNLVLNGLAQMEYRYEEEVADRIVSVDGECTTTVEMTVHGAGAGSANSPVNGTMIFANDRKSVRLTVLAAAAFPPGRRSSTERTTITGDKPDLCLGGEEAEFSEEIPAHMTVSFYEEITLTEPYPKVIAGEQTKTRPDGTKVTYSWRLIRQVGTDK